MSQRNQSVAELNKRNLVLTVAIAALSAASLLVAIKTFTQSEIVVVQTPGMPANSVIERSNFDKAAQMATLYAVTSTVAQINPSNADYHKVFLQSFLSPTAFTRITSEIDAQVAKLTSQRELGSYYFVIKRYEYDPELNRHFVIGDLHTVNAAKDSADPYTFEYLTHIENYRLWVDDLRSYPGDRAHNSEWVKANNK